MNLPLIFPTHSDCRSCPRWAHPPLNPGIPSTQWGLPPSPDTPVLIVIGPTPGFWEHFYNEPFRGKPGRLLREIILLNLSTLCTIYGTTLVRCGPSLNAKSADYKACFPHCSNDLQRIFDRHPPHKIHMLLLGSEATGNFLRKATGQRNTFKDALSQNGKPRTILQVQVPIFVTIHPAAVLRNNSHIHTIEDHIELLTATIQGVAATPTDPDIQDPRPPYHLP